MGKLQGQRPNLNNHVESHRGYGATAARLTPDQKVGSSNLSALIFVNGETFQRLQRICIASPKSLRPLR